MISLPRIMCDILGRVTAWDIIKGEGLNCLPVDSFRIARNNMVHIISYAELSKRKNRPISHYFDNYSTYGFCYFNNQQYYIAYDDTLPMPIARYTIMHELAHIFLGHIGPGHERLPHLSSNDIRESEANRMARRILCPSVVLHFCGCSSAAEIQSLCDVDISVAKIRYAHLRELRKNSDFLRSPYEREVLNAFLKFISDYLAQKNKLSGNTDSCKLEVYHMADNLAHQEIWRDELINGKTVLMSPRPSVNHNIVAGNIYRILGNYLDGKQCTPFGDGTDLYLTDKDRFIPDGMVVCDRNKIKPDGIYGAPDLVIEVLSPSTAKNDRGHKKNVYEQAGVNEYWIVNPADKAVEIYLLDGGHYVLNDVLSLYPDFMLKNMTKEECAAVVTKFKCSLFDDLVISLEDIFKRTF